MKQIDNNSLANYVKLTYIYSQIEGKVNTLYILFNVSLFFAFALVIIYSAEAVIVSLAFLIVSIFFFVVMVKANKEKEEIYNKYREAHPKEMESKFKW